MFHIPWVASLRQSQRDRGKPTTRYVLAPRTQPLLEHRASLLSLLDWRLLRPRLNALFTILMLYRPWVARLPQSQRDFHHTLRTCDTLSELRLMQPLLERGCGSTTVRALCRHGAAAPLSVLDWRRRLPRLP